MKIIVDESVSFGVVDYLRDAGYDVTAVVEESAGLKDADVFELIKKEKAVLITRDHHFTNSFRYPPRETFCIVFIRKGNLSSLEEIDLVKWFLNSFSISDFKGRLVTLSKDHVKVR
jgi:predicted nuclease of predicted toxin-antitoxin system